MNKAFIFGRYNTIWKRIDKVALLVEVFVLTTAVFDLFDRTSLSGVCV